MIDSLIESFTNNLIAEDRYMMILEGLQVTLLITLWAAVFGTLLGGVICWMRMNHRALTVDKRRRDWPWALHSGRRSSALCCHR